MKGFIRVPPLFFRRDYLLEEKHMDTMGTAFQPLNPKIQELILR